MRHSVFIRILLALILAAVPRVAAALDGKAREVVTAEPDATTSGARRLPRALGIQPVAGPGRVDDRPWASPHGTPDGSVDLSWALGLHGPPSPRRGFPGPDPAIALARAADVTARASSHAARCRTASADRARPGGRAGPTTTSPPPYA